MSSDPGTTSSSQFSSAAHLVRPALTPNRTGRVRLDGGVIQSLASATPPQLQVSGGRGPAHSLRGSPPGAPGLAYSKHARDYDRLTRAFDGFRQAIVEALPLRSGDVVLDVGCGTGLCFPMLQEKIGPHGRVIGIDASPEMVAVARDRVADEGWDNVTVLQSPVAEAQIPVSADAALFCAVHDILRSREALHNALDSLQPGAWVTAGGGKWAAPWMVALNWRVRALHAPYVASFEGFDQPWSHLERLIRDVEVQELAWGSGYVATGRVREHDRTR
jgi:SAM-dependent methyltransferase